MFLCITQHMIEKSHETHFTTSIDFPCKHLKSVSINPNFKSKVS